MKVLVVGKGQSNAPYMVAEHELLFIHTPDKGFSTPDLRYFDLGLFHLTHDSNRYAPVLDDWKSGGQIGKVIAVSGKGALTNYEIGRLRRLGNVPFIGNIADMESVRRMRWSSVPIVSSESAATLAKWLVQATSYLVALHILCQGFELAHRGDEETGRALSETQVRETETVEWWLRCLDVSSFEELRQHLSAEKVRVEYIERIEAGFNRARSKATLKSGVGCVCNAVKEALE